MRFFLAVAERSAQLKKLTDLRRSYGVVQPFHVPPSMAEAVSTALSTGPAGNEIRAIKADVANHEEAAVRARREELADELAQREATKTLKDRADIRKLRAEIDALDVRALDAQSSRLAANRRVAAIQEQAVLGTYSPHTSNAVMPQETFNEFLPHVRGSLAEAQIKANAQDRMLARQDASIARFRQVKAGLDADAVRFLSAGKRASLASQSQQMSPGQTLRASEKPARSAIDWNGASAGWRVCRAELTCSRPSKKRSNAHHHRRGGHARQVW